MVADALQGRLVDDALLIGLALDHQWIDALAVILYLNDDSVRFLTSSEGEGSGRRLACGEPCFR